VRPVTEVVPGIQSRTVSGAVAASFAEATPDSLGSRNWDYRRSAAAAGFGMAVAAEGHADREGYPGTRGNSPTTGCMAQNTVGSVAVVTMKMARTGCHQCCNYQCGLAEGEAVARS